MKRFRSLRESHYPTQGSSVEYPPYKEMDMKNLVKDAIDDIDEDDGPHTSDIPDAPNFSTVAQPEDVINQSSSEGNRDSGAAVASRKTGKPFKTLRKKMGYGVEDLSGAVARVAIGEAVKDEADKGEYDYEGDMAKSSLRTIVRNAQMMHDMLSEDENLPEWVASKITLAEDYIVTAAQYMQSEMNEHVEPIEEISQFKRDEIAHELRHEDEYERRYKRPYVAPATRRPTKPASEPHSVHIGGKKWKSFGSHSHASAVAKKLEAKGKKVTVHKDD